MLGLFWGSAVLFDLKHKIIRILKVRLANSKQIYIYTACIYVTAKNTKSKLIWQLSKKLNFEVGLKTKSGSIKKSKFQLTSCLDNTTAVVENVLRETIVVRPCVAERWMWSTQFRVDMRLWVVFQSRSFYETGISFHPLLCNASFVLSGPRNRTQIWSVHERIFCV